MTAPARGTWLAAFLGGMLVVTAWIQLDVADAYLARDFPLGAIGVVVLLSLLLGAGAGQPALLGFLLIPVLLIVLGRWRVTVDRTGLWARSLLGAPRTGVALDQVVRADVVPLHPLREFGGWGVRSDLKGRHGLGLRAGDAIAVQRAGGGVFVATVVGADDAVALLNGLADRARAT